MPQLSSTGFPRYCHHRCSGQAVVTLDGRDFYLGKYNSAESKAEYNRRIQESLSAGRKLPVDPEAITVGEVVLAYIKHAKGYYRRADGTPTNEAARVVQELKHLTKLYCRCWCMTCPMSWRCMGCSQPGISCLGIGLFAASPTLFC